jgi:hypothetical protein
LPDFPTDLLIPSWKSSPRHVDAPEPGHCFVDRPSDGSLVTYVSVGREQQVRLAELSGQIGDVPGYRRYRLSGLQGLSGKFVPDARGRAGIAMLQPFLCVTYSISR